MPVQEAIDGRLMNRFANMELKGVMNLLDGGQFSRLSPLEKRSEKGLFFIGKFSRTYFPRLQPMGRLIRLNENTYLRSSMISLADTPHEN